MLSFSWNSISEQRSDAWHMGSRSVTCHPTQVARLCPSMTGWGWLARFTLHPRGMKGWVDLGDWIWDDLPVSRQSWATNPSSDQPDVEHLR